MQAMCFGILKRNCISLPYADLIDVPSVTSQQLNLSHDTRKMTASDSKTHRCNSEMKVILVNVVNLLQLMKVL